MRFSNGWLLLVILLGACTSNPQQASEPSFASATDTAQAVAVLPDTERTPDPYLHNQPSVDPQARALFETALIAMNKQQWVQAEAQLQRINREYPRLSGPYLNLGLVYRARGELDKADQAFTRAIAVNANNLAAYNQLAIMKREAGQFSAAEALYQQALRVWPFHPESHKNLGILYDLYLGKGALALQHYQAYQQLLAEPDRQVNGWIIDLERRLAQGG